MKLRVKYQGMFERFTVFFSTAIRFMLNALVLVISIAIIAGVVKAAIQLFGNLDAPLERLLSEMLLDIILIVALIEVSLVILGYLKDGAVHVRYIVDTVLIIMLNKVVSSWYQGGSTREAVSLATLILALAVVRITTIKWSAENPAVTGPSQPQQRAASDTPAPEPLKR